MCIRDKKEASRCGLMVADENDKITECQEKPPVSKSNLASMGIYIFNWDVLKKYLEEDEADPNSKNDFGMNLSLIHIYPAPLRAGKGHRLVQGHCKRHLSEHRLHRQL